MTGCQNDNGAAVLLHFPELQRLLAYLHMLTTGAIQTDITPHQMQNDLTIQQLNASSAKQG